MRIGAFEMKLNLRPRMKFELEERREKRLKLSLQIACSIIPDAETFTFSIEHHG